MITLSEAIRLCDIDIDEEPIYLRAADDPKMEEHYFWGRKLCNRLDCKRIKVVTIRPRFEKYGVDFLGMLFVVRGIAAEDLRRESNYCMQH